MKKVHLKIVVEIVHQKLIVEEKSVTQHSVGLKKIHNVVLILSNKVGVKKMLPKIHVMLVTMKKTVEVLRTQPLLVGFKKIQNVLLFLKIIGVIKMHQKIPVNKYVLQTPIVVELMAKLLGYVGDHLILDVTQQSFEKIE